MSKKKNTNVIEIHQEKKNPLNETFIAFAFVLIITITFLFPAFLGKVECPVDIRNYYYYPWKYHTTDKHLIKQDLTRVNLEEVSNSDKDSNGNNKQKVYKLDPLSRKEILLNLNIDDFKNIIISNNFNYYLCFEFLPSVNKNEQLNFGVYVSDKNKNVANLPFSAFPVKTNGEEAGSKWHFAKANLNFVLDEIKSFEKLKDFNIYIVVQNSGKAPSSLTLNNVKVISEDFSNLKSKAVHNYFLEDLILWFTPARESFSNSLKKGKIPFWNNYILSGTEFIAEPQVGFFNPIYFLAYFLFDHFTAHSIILIIFFILNGIGSYMLARHWKFTFQASLLTSLVYMFNPYLLCWFGYEHTLMCNSILPFLLLFYDKSINEKKILNPYLIYASALAGLLFLSGHLQVVYYSLFFLGMYAIFKFLISSGSFKEKCLNQIPVFIFIVLFGLAIGSIVLIQFFPLLSNSHRLPLSEEYLRGASCTLEALKGLIYPYYKGKISWLLTDRYSLDPAYMNYKNRFFKNYYYFGVLPFLISLFAFRVTSKNKLVPFFYFSICFSILCSSFPDFYLLIRNLIPGFSLLQNTRFLEIYSYSVPFLAGIGFMSLFECLPKINLKTKKILTSLILIISAIDLIYFSSFYVTWSERGDYKPVHRGGVIEFLQKEKESSKEPFRVLSVESPYNIGFGLKPTSSKPNFLLPYGIEEINGYSSFLPKDFYWLFMYVKTKNRNILYAKEDKLLNKNTNIVYPFPEYKDKILDLLNVKYFLTSSDFSLDSTDAVKLFDGDSRLWLNKNYLPRAFISSSYELVPNKSDLIVKLNSDEFNPCETVLFNSIDNKTKIILHKFSQSDENVESKIDFEKYENENIILNVKTNKAGILVLGNNLNDNWRVKVNNIPQDILKVNLVQAGVLLSEAGDYKVEYYYYPKRFYIGLGATIGAFLILLTILGFISCKSKKRKL